MNKKFCTNKLTPEIITKYYYCQAKKINVDLVPKTTRGALDMLDTLYDLRVSTVTSRHILGEELHGDMLAILTMIETDIRIWLEKSVQ